MPKANRLRKPSEFKEVYTLGKRFDGRFMTVFIKPSSDGIHRLGVTASKKAIGNAVERNRSKRLLREAFRLSKLELAEVLGDYDWVLNAKRTLLKVKLEEPLKEFRYLIGKVKVFEQSKGEESSVNESK